jgi:hypothetical protein
MRLNRFLSLAAGLAVSASLVTAGSVSYTCDASIDAAQAGTCAYLNGAIAGLYSSTFTNANASIYITYGATGLGQSTQYENFVGYDQYRSALIAGSSGDAVDVGAIASLPATEPAIYNNANVNVTAALGTLLGLPVTGITTPATGENTCTIGDLGCYDAIITLATPSSLAGGGQGYYYRQNGGSAAGNQYDIYSVAEHETDEVLGTSSCIGTTGSLSNGCSAGSGSATSPSAVDLFRYNAGARVLISGTAGAYFSYDGGVTNGAAGAIYNTLANGDDYADFASNCTFVQDATGCLGQSLDITTDGGAEANILDAVGYNRNTSSAVPEPGTMSLMGAALAFIVYRRRGYTA